MEIIYQNIPLVMEIFINRAILSLNMLKERLKEIITEQAEQPPKSNLIGRTLFTSIEAATKDPFITIITGIRRCGKSTLLGQLRKKHPGHYVNFDDDRFANFKVEDFQAMNEALIELYGEKDTFYFDEIQNIPEWERFARRLHDSNKKVFITGSNATMLSRELGTHLTGRHLQIRLYPFSFKEFLSFKGISHQGKEKYEAAGRAKLKSAFKEYLLEGGFPEYLLTKNKDYLKTLYENIIYRDILIRYNLSNEKIMKELVHFIAGNISKEISFNSLKRVLGLGSSTTVKEYFGYLENSFLVYLIPKFEYSLKKQIYSNKKVYLIDNGLAVMLGYRVSNDKGRLLENMVFIDLKRRGSDIYYHRGKRECDFLCAENLKVNQAIQVCYELNDETKERELQGILEAMKEYKLKTGLILTFDQEEELTIENKKITVKPVWKWLLE